MGNIATMVMDAAGIQAMKCLLPDSEPVSSLAAQLAVLMHNPKTDFDGKLLSYGLVVKGGKVLDPDTTLKAAVIPVHSTIYLVPEITAAQDDPNDDLNPPKVPEKLDPPKIEVVEHISLLHDDGLNLIPNVRMNAETYRELEQFAIRDRDSECVGLLLGIVAIEGKSRVVRVTAIAPATDVESTRSSVKITSKAWESMLRMKDERYSDLRILGWFHSHSGWGVFMSDADVFLHSSFFPHPNMVAYVIDPTIGRDGFFYWLNGKVAQCANYALEAESSAVSFVAEHRKSIFANLGVRIGIAAAILIGLAGLFVVRMPHESQVPSKKIAAKPHKAIVPKKVKPVQKTPVRQPDKIYILGKTENLWIVCDRVYQDGSLAPALAKYNGLSGYSGLQVGQKIKLPPKSVLKKPKKK